MSFARKTSLGAAILLAPAILFTSPFLSSPVHAQQSAAARSLLPRVSVSCNPLSALPAHVIVPQGTALELKGSINNTDVQTTFRLVSTDGSVVASGDFFSTPTWSLVWDTSHQEVKTYTLNLLWSRQTQAGGYGDWHQAGHVDVEITEAPIPSMPAAQPNPSLATPASPAQNRRALSYNLRSRFRQPEVSALEDQEAKAEEGQKVVEGQISQLQVSLANAKNAEDAEAIKVKILSRQNEVSYFQSQCSLCEDRLERIDPAIRQARDADIKSFNAAKSAFSVWQSEIVGLENNVHSREDGDGAEIINRVNRGQSLDKAYLIGNYKAALALKTQLVTFLRTRPIPDALNDEDKRSINTVLPHRIAYWKIRMQMDRLDIDLAEGKQHLKVGVEPGMEAQSPQYSDPKSPEYMGKDVGDGTYLHSPEMETLEEQSKAEELQMSFDAVSHRLQTRYFYLESAGLWYSPQPNLQ